MSTTRPTTGSVNRRSLLALAAAGLSSPSGARAAELAVQPGDDFFAHANADWLQAREASTPGQPWTARQDIHQLTQAQVEALWAGADGQSAHAVEHKLAQFRDACLDSAWIEALGLAPLRPLLARISALRDPSALALYLGSELRADVDPLYWGVFASPHLFGLAVQPGVQGEGRYQAYLLQGGLGLGEPATYLDDSAQAREQRAGYLDHLIQTLGRLGASDAAVRANAVLDLERRIAAGHETAAASDDPHRAEHRWTLAEFGRRAPGLDWPRFFAAAGLGGSAVAWQPDAIRAQAALLGSQPLAVWRDYLSLHLVQRHAEVLPQGWSVQPAPADRSQQARLALDKSWPEAMGQLYVERHFPPQVRARVQAIVAEVMAATADRLTTCSWMCPAARRVAQAKLAALYFGVGHPDRWRDHRALRLDSRDAWGNQRRLALWKTRQALARLGRPLDPHEWWIPAQAVAAGSQPLQNNYNFAAGLLQAPKFDPQASDASNLGATGSIFGHEISHLFDEVGADFDEGGRLRPWWTPEDRAGLARVSQPLIEQIASYRPLPDLGIDPQRTLTETRADLVGLSLAFDAHRRRLSTADAETVRQADREFFLGYARSWRSVSTEASLRQKLQTDSHAPDRYRIALVRNLDAWYAAFDVRPGQALYLEPAQRVQVW